MSIKTTTEAEAIKRKMAEMIRDKAREQGDHELANASLETIMREHEDVLRRLGYTPNRLPS